MSSVKSDVNSKPGYWVVVPAAGSGQRMQSDIPKQYLQIRQRTILEYTLDCFSAHPNISGIVLVLSAGDRYWPELDYRSPVPLHTVDGGDERCHSVMNALEYLKTRANDNDWILVHDAARPCLHVDDLDSLMQSCESAGSGGLLAVPVRDTLKRGNADHQVVETVSRENLWQALTPQMFRLEILYNALNQCLSAGLTVTDEASAIEQSGLQPILVQGRSDNIKVTLPSDLELADRILQSHSRSQSR